MNKLIAKVKFIGTFLVIAAMCLPAMNVRAAQIQNEVTPSTYTVTFRPGNVGCFALNSGDEESKKDKASAVAAQCYSGYTYEVTENGAIKVKVSNGIMPAVPTYIQADAGYFVKDASVWGPSQNTVVDKNMDFVVDYGKLVDGVEYTVEYVDSASGESVAPVYIAQANIGDPISVTAPDRIVLSEGTVYKLSSEASLTKDLDADSTNNVFTFRYTLAPGGTVEEEITNYVDGGTVTTTETYTTFVDNGTTVIPAQGQAGAGDAGDAADGGAAEAENEDGNVTIEDEPVPLAPSADENENGGNMVVIEDDEVPLADFANEGGVNTMAVVAGVFVAAALAVMVIWLRMKKRKEAIQTIDSSEE